MIDSEAGKRRGRQAGVDSDILTDRAAGGKQFFKAHYFLLDRQIAARTSAARSS
jgi:hypothetical protein